MIRADSQNGRILRVLADGKPHTVPEIHRRAGTSRLNSRISELRKAGYVIDCERVPGRKGAGAYRYRLHHALPGDATLGLLNAILDETIGDAPTVPAENYAPRDERNRYRLYRLVADDLQLIATCESPEAVGVALCTLGSEQEWERAAFGVLDTNGGDEKPGTWLVNPYDADARW